MTESLPQFEFVEVPPRRRGRRWIAPASVLAGILVLLVAAFFVADGMARGYAAGLIRDKVRSSLSLPEKTPIDVTVGGTSVLFQLLSGSLEDVRLSVNGLSVGALNGDVTLTARGIPIDQSRPIDSLRLQFSADQAELTKMLSGFSGFPVRSVAIDGGSVQLGTSFTVLGVDIPVGLSLKPAAAGGDLTLTPTGAMIGGNTVTPATLRSTFGPAADLLLATQRICVASQLPQRFVLHSVRVAGKRVVLVVTATSVSLNHDLLTTKGSCPAT